MIRTQRSAALARSVLGATLLEVMIALVIMSIGLLGLASLELSGMSANSNSEKRTQAAIIANDMVERMRANPTAVSTGAYDAELNNPVIDCTVAPAKICEDRSSPAADCTPAEMAKYDADTAYCNAKALLPSGALSVWCSDTAGNTQACVGAAYRTVRVNWQNQTESGNTAKFLTMTVRP